MRRLLVLALLLLGSPASANLGKRSSDADPAGEPHGMIDVAISREDLAIDLRPLETGGRALVDVAYQLDNRGEAKQLALIFASGASSLHGFKVALDGAPIRSGLGAAGALPKSWQAPPTTPGPSGPLSFEVDRMLGAATFDLTIPPGTHRLVISYGARPSIHHAGEPMVMHQFAYVLAPARTWSSFGQLAITVHVPSGWDAEVEPALARRGDTLEGTFTGVPADAVAITTHSPAGLYQVLRVVGLLGFAVALLGGGVALWRIMSVRGRRHARAGYLGSDTAVAFALALVWAGAIGALGWFAMYGRDLALVKDQADHRGYGDELAMVGIVLLSLAAVLIGTLLGRFAVRREAQVRQLEAP